MSGGEILSLAGDGIGPEITAQAHRVIDWLNDHASRRYTLSEALIGGAAFDAHGTPLPDETLDRAHKADAVLLGAVGAPRYDTLAFESRPERGLLGLRRELGLFANLRPAGTFEALSSASSLKPEVVRGLDIMIVRELTGGIYFGQPRGIETLKDGRRRGFNTLVYDSGEIERIARVGFDLARQRRGRLCSVDKANVLEATVLWREEVTRLAEEYPDVELSHMYVDNAAMQLVRAPDQFDVIVTTNMFGDILSDITAMLTGSLGMLASASVGEPTAAGRRRGMYEPIHGSAPDIAGENRANPLAMILSCAMMLRSSFDDTEGADGIEAAVRRVLDEGFRTADIMEEGKTPVSTSGMGDRVIEALKHGSIKA